MMIMTMVIIPCLQCHSERVYKYGAQEGTARSLTVRMMTLNTISFVNRVISWIMLLPSLHTVRTILGNY